MATSTGDSTGARTRRHSLDPLVRPASIAVIGASSAPSKAGHQLMRALAGFTGRLYPVNPGAGEILGHTAHPSIGAVPEPVDLAVLMVPAEVVPAVIGECAAAGARAAIVCAGGLAGGRRGHRPGGPRPAGDRPAARPRRAHAPSWTRPPASGSASCCRP